MNKALALAAFLLVSCTAEAPTPEIVVENAWARAAAHGRSSTAVYLTIRNTGGGDRLVEVSSPAGEASLHSTSMAGGIMRMRSVEAVDDPAGAAVTAGRELGALCGSGRRVERAEVAARGRKHYPAGAEIRALGRQQGGSGGSGGVRKGRMM